MAERAVDKDDWITLEPSGTHVMVDGNGNIVEGPTGLSGKPVGNLSPRKPSEPEKPDETQWLPEEDETQYLPDEPEETQWLPPEPEETWTTSGTDNSGSQDAPSSTGGYSQTSSDAPQGASYRQDLHPLAQTAMKGIAEAINGSSSLSPAQKASYFNTSQEVLHSMSEQALGKFNNYNPGPPTFHKDPKSLGESVFRGRPEQLQLITSGQAELGGALTAAGLHLDGGHEKVGPREGEVHTQHEIYAHEMSHVLDSSTLHERHSDSKEWQAAWKKEMVDSGHLSEYAKTEPSEGWAEFGRAVLMKPESHGYLQKRFPGCFSYWQKHGLVKESSKKSKNGWRADIPELFDKRMPIGDSKVSHGDSLLKKRSNGKSGGVGVNAVIKRLQKGELTHERDDGARTRVWVMTTETTDRDKETVDPTGGDFSEYLLNATTLWNHDTAKEPIGTIVDRPWNDYVGEGTKYPEILGPKRMALLGRIYFSKEDAGEKAWRMTNEEPPTLKAGSISFVPTGPVQRNAEGGNHYPKWKLLEFSLCSVGSNPDAVATKQKSIDKASDSQIESEIKNRHHGKIHEIVARYGEGAKSALLKLESAGKVSLAELGTGEETYAKRNGLSLETFRRNTIAIGDNRYVEYDWVGEKSIDKKPIDPDKYAFKVGDKVFARTMIIGGKGGVFARAGDPLRIVREEGGILYAENKEGETYPINTANARKSVDDHPVVDKVDDAIRRDGFKAVGRIHNAYANDPVFWAHTPEGKELGDAHTKLSQSDKMPDRIAALDGWVSTCQRLRNGADAKKQRQLDKLAQLGKDALAIYQRAKAIKGKTMKTKFWTKGKSAWFLKSAMPTEAAYKSMKKKDIDDVTLHDRPPEKGVPGEEEWMEEEIEEPEHKAEVEPPPEDDENHPPGLKHCKRMLKALDEDEPGIEHPHVQEAMKTARKAYEKCMKSAYKDFGDTSDDEIQEAMTEEEVPQDEQAPVMEACKALCKKVSHSAPLPIHQKAAKVFARIKNKAMEDDVTDKKLTVKIGMDGKWWVMNGSQSVGNGSFDSEAEATSYAWANASKYGGVEGKSITGAKVVDNGDGTFGVSGAGGGKTGSFGTYEEAAQIAKASNLKNAKNADGDNCPECGYRDGGYQRVGTERECPNCGSTFVCKGAKTKRLNKAEHDVIEEACKAMDDMADDTSTKRHHAAGLRHHSASLKAKFNKGASDDEMPDMGPEVEMAMKSFIEASDRMGDKYFKASGKRF